MDADIFTYRRGEKLLNQRDWSLVHSFELREKRRFLKKLTTKKSQGIFKNLYQFAQEINKAYYNQFNLRDIQALIKTHFIFMKVKV